MEVEMDASGVHHHHHQQEISERLEICTKAPEEIKKPRPEEALKCPRCDSINTKFCYYNNYSLTQPRYFCKSCRRYWTKGGTLRNVPVGGGCRKNKRSSSSSPPNSSSTINGHQDHHRINVTNNPMLSGLPHLPYDSTCTDLSLAFANGHLGFDHFAHNENVMGFNHPSSNYTPGNPQGGDLGFLENTHNGFHNVLYEGNIVNEDMGILENGGILMGLTNNSHGQNLDQEILNSTVKQETISGGVLWGFPWQIGGGDEGNEIGSVRSQINGWNGVGSTTWHGLLNSPLMY